MDAAYNVYNQECIIGRKTNLLQIQSTVLVRQYIPLLASELHPLFLHLLLEVV